jgi:DNA-binding transcriptional MerR regulator
MVVDRINEMKSQGLPTGQIVQNLKQEGITPKEINEALGQSQVPNSQQNNPQNPTQPNPMNQQAADPTAQMQQSQLSVSQQPTQEQPPMYQSPTQQPTNQMQQQPIGSTQMQQSTPIQPNENIMPQSTEYQGQPLSPSYQDYQQGYDEYPEYAPQQSMDVETINDLATQIIEDKIQDLRDNITGFTKFRKQIEDQTIEMEKRLTQIELTMSDLQMAIIKKVGEYGENINNISNELKATQDSFSKLANPLMDKRDLEGSNPKSNSQEKTTQPKPANPTNKSQPKSKSKKSTSFEDYLR